MELKQELYDDSRYISALNRTNNGIETIKMITIQQKTLKLLIAPIMELKPDIISRKHSSHIVS